MKNLKKPTKKITIGERARELLAKPLTYPAILKQIKREFRGAKTNVACLQWYASAMRRDGGKPKVKRAA